MAGVVARRRFVLGRDLDVVSASGADVVLEGRVRLQPGRTIDVCDADVKTMVVMTWEIARLGKDGPVFRGRCRVVQSRG